MELYSLYNDINKPEAAGILLSLNGTFVKHGLAAGASFGGIVVSRYTLSSILWIAMIAGVIAAIVGTLSFKSTKK
jgi:predicted MFS family arabinose efflux permease